MHLVSASLGLSVKIEVLLEGLILGGPVLDAWLAGCAVTETPPNCHYSCLLPVVSVAGLLGAVKDLRVGVRRTMMRHEVVEFWVDLWPRQYLPQSGH